MNISWSRKIISELCSKSGVREVIVCAGARNSPLVSVLARTEGLSVQSFFEERSAAFYALGVARRTDRPVALVTTSGTAAAELLPAAIEAFHSGVPLVLVTADRPKRLRGTGAPQAIDQTGLFAKFVEIELDLEAGEGFDLSQWTRRAPVHLNICLDEPLIDETHETLRPEISEKSGFAGLAMTKQAAGPEWASLRLLKFLKAEEPMVAVVGRLETEVERETVAELLKRLRVPVYLEGNSGLRERVDLSGLSLKSGDKVLAWALKKKLFSRVLRIGGVPTVRIWRDLDDPRGTVETLSLTSLPFAGLSRGEMICAEIAPTLMQAMGSPALDETSEHRELSPETKLILDTDFEAAQMLEGLFREEPLAESSLVNSLSKKMADGALVYVGNSLPIREWDLAAARERVVAVEANRGVNGIDGQISTYLGLASAGQENWAIIGDLTAMYDLAGPWAIGARGEKLDLRMVVINNGGGKIFSRIFGDALFENRHSIAFEGWAKMWNLDYQLWREIPSSIAFYKPTVIEIVPDADATARFWDRYDSYWKSRD